MYIKLRKDGAVGLGRATKGKAEITIGYGEAHMVAAALEKVAQTPKEFHQTYKKTTNVGGGNEIEFDREKNGAISISGDGYRYSCSEEEILQLVKSLRDLPPLDTHEESRFVSKNADALHCVTVENKGNSVKLTLPEAAVLRTSLLSSMEGQYYTEVIEIGKQKVKLERTSGLKWQLIGKDSVKFTAYEIEELVEGIESAIMDVLMKTANSMGIDEVSDIRVKSRVQRIEEDTKAVVENYAHGRRVRKRIKKMAEKVLGAGEDAASRTNHFMEVANYIYRELEPEYFEPLFGVLASTFLPTIK
ncbi:MAG: hypothetical protein GF309_00810 [Candidatus Lokiarchaeota archaeon]|nr:hypothetical protein [Candidatus Lokiarchaeota archaeon]